MGVKERKEREKEKRREEIIKAGESLFVNKGLNATTMDEIAAKCELSKGTLYLYFESKESLFLTIMVRAMTVLFDVMKEYAASVNDPIEKLRKIGEAYFDFHDKNPDYFKFLSFSSECHVWNSPGNEAIDDAMQSKDVGNELMNKNRDVWALIIEIIKDGISLGVFKKNTDPREVSLSLWAMSTMVIQMMDHVRAFDHHKCGDDIFSGLDFKQVLMRNGQRIIYSILQNPPADFEFI